MNRQDRASIWRDETAHPLSPTTYFALQASGASPELVAEWQDLEGHNEPSSDWMTYEDFLKGSIGITQDHGRDEFGTVEYHVECAARLMHLWEELGKVTNEPHNAMGEDLQEKERYDAIREAHNRQALEKALENSIADSNKEHIIEIPGVLFARWNEERVTGFGFAPPNVAEPEFRHLDGPGDPRYPLNDYGAGFWLHLQQYLQTVLETSGEATIAVVWHEDGWKCSAI